MSGPPSNGEARAEIRRRLEAALVDRPAAVAIPRDYEHRLPAEVDLVELFAERVADYRATVHRTTADGLATTIASVLAEHGVRTLVAPAGVPLSWLERAEVELVGDDPPLTVDALDAIDATITGCALAIAETGTFVLDAGVAQGRRVLSLLPDRHVCVIRADQIVGTVPEALARLDPRRPQTWVSGPSATSDIELDRVEGVHGPRILDVIIVATTDLSR
jgi:L-lactate dehydrogenase complex protein LldG